MSKAKIPYFDENWNVTKGCSPISAGCHKCWAEIMAKRLAGKGIRGYSKEFPMEPMFCSWLIDIPRKTDKPTIFGVSFMGDLFHDNITEKERGEIFATMVLNPRHKFILLTKRPENMIRSAILSKKYHSRSTDHIWFGCSIEDNFTLERLTHMVSLKALGVNTWLSIEPLLEDVSEGLKTFLKANPCIDGIIVGGESGPGARYCNPFWIASIVDLCIGNNIPIYFKQWGTYDNWKTTSIVDQLKYQEKIESYKQLPWK